MKIYNFDLFGPSRDASRTSLGVSWRLLGSLESRRRLTWAAWERFGPSFRILGVPGRHLGPS
eukprot:1528737-Pyramimonas_sp.AAC.1